MGGGNQLASEGGGATGGSRGRTDEFPKLLVKLLERDDVARRGIRGGRERRRVERERVARGASRGRGGGSVEIGHLGGARECREERECVREGERRKRRECEGELRSARDFAQSGLFSPKDSADNSGN